jgi:hypothetical protein
MNKLKNKLTWISASVVASAALVLGAAGIAAAKGDGGQGVGNGRRAAMMQKFDANGDGVLDDAERAKLRDAFAAKRAQRKAAMLARYDADRDGALSPAERAQATEERAGARFAKLDANGDGVLSLDEFKAGHHKRGHHHRRGQ